MYQVALVQNQSEMAHYGYADARPIINDLGYTSVLYTADNIEDLRHALMRKNFDAVVFGSNALNDKTIRAETFSEGFVSIFSEWLSSGRGVLCLHQLRLATMEDSSLKFLPSPLNLVKAIVRPPTEESASGGLAIPTGAERHIALLYPNRVNANAVWHHALNFKSLPGLYWHYWDNANFADWDRLVVDPAGTSNLRDLILSAKESSPYRIILSALTLDWQKQRSLIENLLGYVVEGRHNTAVLADEYNTNTAFNYLIGTLQSRKFPFRQYSIGQNLEALVQHLENGVHTTLLIGPFIEREQLPTALSDAISTRVLSGNLKLLSIEAAQHGIRKFSVIGRERYVNRLLNSIELKIQGELMKGYVDGSFWSTAETLQTLTALPQATAYYERLVDMVLRQASEHDRNGSYDEVFGVTCAFLWMRATYLGVNSNEAIATALWIRDKVTGYEDREKALAYTTFAYLGLLNATEQEILKRILTRLTLDRLSEIDLIVYMRAALSIREYDIVPALIKSLGQKQFNGAWIDLATTATAATTLIDALAALKTLTVYAQTKPSIEKMIFQAVINIQDALERSLMSMSQGAYPWDGKASTTVKCLQAWLKFDEMLDLPVYEVVETLSRYDAVSTQFASGRNALSVLEELKEENQGLSGENAKIILRLKESEGSVKKLRLLSILLRLAIVTAVILIYTIITLAVGISNGYGSGGFGALFRQVVVDAWGFHLGFVGVVATIAALPWGKWLGLYKNE